MLQPAQRDALPEQEELEARAGALELGRLARRHVAVVLRALVPQELHLGRGPREVAAVVSHGRDGAGPGPRVPDRGRDRAAATEQPGKISPLLVAPRSIRHAAVDILPALVSGVTSEMSAIIEHLSRRSDVAEQLLLQLMAASEPPRSTPRRTPTVSLRLANSIESRPSPGARVPSPP